MPLRDHFHPPLTPRFRWDVLHGAWPTLIVIALNRILPARFVAGPNIHLGSGFEIDIGAKETEEPLDWEPAGAFEAAGGTATAVWAPPRPTLSVATDAPEVDEYEVQVFDTENEHRLVAAIEIVSPSNKDRPDHRQAFVTKCAALVQQQVSVAIVDVVTDRNANLYVDVLESLGQTDPSFGAEPPPLYATECRWTKRWSKRREAWFLETWAHPLEVGHSLPVLPLWLTEDFAVPLELEPCYEETCRILRMT